MFLDPALLAWGWLIFAMILFVAEIFTVGFLLAAFGVGALAAAVVAFLGLDVQWQLLVFVIVSSVAVVLSRNLAERITRRQAVGVGIDRVLGKQAVVLEAIDDVHATGIVRVDREQWRAQSADHEIIPVDTVVEVVGVEGTRLIVRPLRQED